jgi:protein O-GlcNAc transferase
MADRLQIRAALEAGLRHHQAGQFAEARGFYEQALALDARQADALHLLGVIAHQSGEDEKAAEMIKAAITVNPQIADYHSNLGNALLALGRLEESVAAYEAALRLRDYAEGHYNLGNARLAQKEFGAALAAYDAAIALRAGYVEAHSNRSNALAGLGRAAEAIAACEAAIRLNPAYEAAHYKLGNFLLAEKKFDAAIAAYNQAIRLRPDYADAHANRGSALMSLGQAGQALVAYEAALRAAPGQASAHYNLGTALQALNRFEGAISAYENAIRLQPEYGSPHSNLVTCLHYHTGHDEAAILQAAQRFAAHVTPRSREVFANTRETERRLRVGYVSGDFCSHTVADYFAPVLAAHDPAMVEVFCYHNNYATDDVTKKLRAAAPHWRDVAGLTDEECTARIMADGIDILVDLSGHTNKNRLGVFARRAAPVQASWLGFWGTTGVAAMDYVISDSDTIPPGREAHYSEKIHRLPGSRFCYQPPGYAPAPAPPPSLDGRPVVFGSFNNLAKLGPKTIMLWAQVLLGVPDAKLLLKWNSLGSEATRQELIDAFRRAGIGPERLILRGGSLHHVMLGEYADVDIALDPFPFSGGVTSCEALWMGVPVLTLPGASAASRQTLGFLRAIGRPEWAASNVEEFVRMAMTMAGNRQKLAEYRAGQRARMAGSALCAPERFTQDLEETYRTLWRAAVAS